MGLVFSSRWDFARGLPKPILNSKMNDLLLPSKFTNPIFDFTFTLSAKLAHGVIYIQGFARHQINFDSDGIGGFFTYNCTNKSFSFIQFLDTKIIYNTKHLLSDPNSTASFDYVPSTVCSILCVMLGLRMLFDFCGCDLLISFMCVFLVPIMLFFFPRISWHDDFVRCACGLRVFDI